MLCRNAECRYAECHYVECCGAVQCSTIVLTFANHFQPSLLFEGKASNLPGRGAPEKCFTWVGSCLTCKHYTIQEKLARDEHSGLL